MTDSKKDDFVLAVDPQKVIEKATAVSAVALSIAKQVAGAAEGAAGVIRERVPNPADVAAEMKSLWQAGVPSLFDPRAAYALARAAVSGTPKAGLLSAYHAARSPNSAALIFNGRTFTWSEERDRVRRLSWILAGLGVDPAHAVAIALGNRPEFVETQQAGLLLGAQVCFVSPKSTAEQASELLQRTNSVVLVTDREDLTAPNRILVGDDFEARLGNVQESGSPPAPKDAKARVVIFTSGTTGRPKGAVRDLDQAASAGAFAGFLESVPFKAGDVHLVVSPMYHSTGSGFATASQVLGSALVLVDKFSPEAFCEAVQTNRVNTTAVVPTMLQRLVEFPQVRNYDLSSLRVVVCTGSALREELRAQVREILGDVVYDLYGSTEMGWVTVASPHDQRTAPGTVGRAVRGIELSIRDSDFRQLPRGVPGEIWARSKVLMDDYLDDPELSATRVRDGWISVRDVGYLDARGYLHLIDRADDMIVSGGVNVYPAEAEVALLKNPAVKQAVAFGVDDPEWGQKVVACVVAESGTQESDLIAEAKKHAPAAAVPKQVVIVDEFPLSHTGKVDKKALKAANFS